MLSRVSRLTTLSAQVIGACPLWRENASGTQPKPVAPVNNVVSNFATLLPPTANDNRRQRNASINCDPFLGHTTDAESDVIHELELLDLDRWNSDRLTGIPSGMTNANSRFVNHDSRIANNDRERPHSFMENFVDLSSLEIEPMLDWNCVAPPTSPEMQSPLEMKIEHASSLVDWDAWNRYLDEDEEEFVKVADNFHAAVKEEPADEVCYSQSQSPLTVASSADDVKLEPYEDDTYQDFAASEIKCEFDDGLHGDLATSGPLMWIPSQESNLTSTRSSLSRESKRTRYYANLSGSLSPSLDDEDVPAFKKRGIKMKPSVNDETDRRRALNREAALRYREKKRLEQVVKKRELKSMSERNRELRQKERQLRLEITKIRQKLVDCGAL